MKHCCWVLALGLAVLVLAGCGKAATEGTEPSTSAQSSVAEETVPAKPPGPPRFVEVTLDGWVGPENVAIAMAQELGYFEEGGLQVSFTHPVAPVLPVRYVADGTVDFAISHMPEVALAKKRGKPIVAVGSLISQPTAAMIWLKRSGIDGIADLKGRTIAFPGLPFQKVLLGTVLGRAGLTLDDVRLKTVLYNSIPALVSGRADAIFGGSANLEGAVLETRGLDPVVTPVQSLGIPDYDELVLIARTRQAARSPKLIRDFMAALAKGTAAAVADPTRAVKVVEEAFEANPELGREELEAEMKATLPLLSKSGSIDSRVGR